MQAERPWGRMSRLLGKALTNSLLDYLRSDPKSQEGRAILLVTVDPQGWPHAALLSSWEVFATDDTNIKVATYVGSSTTANLERGGKATLVFFDAGNTYYIKSSVTLTRKRLESDASNSLFNLKVESVLEDSMPGVKVTGISFEGSADVEQHAPLHREIVDRGS
jgi:hypothetical protein